MRRAKCSRRQDNLSTWTGLNYDRRERPERGGGGRQSGTTHRAELAQICATYVTLKESQAIEEGAWIGRQAMS